MEDLKSGLFKEFKLNAPEKVLGGAVGNTSKSKDCNPTGYDDDNSGWRSDSRKTETDTVRADDNCNPSATYHSENSSTTVLM